MYRFCRCIEVRRGFAMLLRCIEPLENRVLLSHPAAAGTVRLPQYTHVVIVVEENHNYNQVLGNNAITMPMLTFPIGIMLPGSSSSDDPFIRSIAKTGLNFTKASGESHPSLPNYLALFSGSTQGVTSDASPKKLLTTPSLGGQLIARKISFAGYSEDLPATGSTVEKSGSYARKHNPWSMFADVPPSANRPFSAF